MPVRRVARAAQAWASSIPACRGSRAAMRCPPRRVAAPSSISDWACSSRQGDPPSTATLSRSRSRSPVTRPCTRRARPRAPAAPQARASSHLLGGQTSGVGHAGEGEQRAVREDGGIAPPPLGLAPSELLEVGDGLGVAALREAQLAPCEEDEVEHVAVGEVAVEPGGGERGVGRVELALGDERLDERGVSHPSDAVARLPCHLDGVARLALGVEQSALGEAQHRPQARRAGEPDDRAPPADVGERLVPAAIRSLEVTGGDDREAGVHDQAGVAGLLGDQPAIEGSRRRACGPRSPSRLAGRVRGRPRRAASVPPGVSSGMFAGRTS